MRSNRIVRGLLAVLAALPLAMLPFAHAVAQEGSAPAAGDGPAWPETVDLQEEDIKGMLSVSRELKAMGVKLARRPDGSIGVDGTMEQNEAAREVLADAGFTPQRLQEVAFTVGLAMASLDGDMEQARAQVDQFEQMKEQVPPEQWGQFDANVRRMRELLALIEGQPEGNLVLVELYQDELRRVFDAS